MDGAAESGQSATLGDLKGSRLESWGEIAAYRLGLTLNFDPETQMVKDADEANLLLREGDRNYRAPFVVPENV